MLINCLDCSRFSVTVMAYCTQKVRDKQMKKENIFEVTFTNSSTVFIQAMDEAHARRIVERNGTTWTRADDKVEMVIKSITECE